MGSDKRLSLDRLAEEHDNLRAAHAWVLETGNVEAAMRMVAALWRFWQMRGYLVEGLERARAAIDLPEADQHQECLARALDAAGGLAYWTGDGQVASGFYERALELQRRLGNRAGEAWTLYSLAFTDTYWGNIAEQRFTPHRLDRAVEHMREAIAIYREIGDRLGMARALWGEANVIWTQNPPVDSEPFLRSRDDALEALAIFLEAGDTFMTGWCTYTLALLDLRTGDLPMAGERLVTSLRIFRDAGDVTGYVLVLDALALHAERTGDRERAARLSGAVSVLERRTGTGLNPPNRVALGFDHVPLREGAETAGAWVEGTRMTPDEAVAYALEGAGG
jgi:tetratricopeptide (TPR) repeat protein